MNPRSLPFPVVILILFSITFAGCRNTDPELSREYLAKLEEWKQERVQDVTKNWLTLEALEWLKEGENTFGSDTSNQLLLPSIAPGKIGSIILRDDSVSVVLEEGVAVLIEDSLIESRNLQIDPGTIFQTENIEWAIIHRTENYALRVWNKSTPLDNDFKIQTYNTEKEWILTAEFQPYSSEVTYPIANIMGTTTDTPIPGKFTFDIDQSEFSLDVMEGGNDTWFLIFGDLTNGEETYGAGRYLYVPKSADGNPVTLDFNKAQNPPCAFTEFATCPLPPPQNRIPVAIKAGEKSEYTEAKI